MERIKLLLLIGLLGCSKEDPTPSVGDVASSPYAIQSKEYVGSVTSGLADNGLYRFENHEVVCYVYYAYQKGGLSCKFK